MQRLTEYIGESVSMKKRIGIGRLQKSRASQINYIEGVYHGIVRSVLKVKGMNGLFVTMKAMCLSVKKDVVFVEF